MKCLIILLIIAMTISPVQSQEGDVVQGHSGGMQSGYAGGMQSGYAGGMAGGFQSGMQMGMGYGNYGPLGCEQEVKFKAQRIISKMGERNVEDLVDDLEFQISKCKLDPASFGWGKRTFKYWRDQGRKSEIKKLSYLAQFKDITDTIPENLKDDSEIKKIISLGKRNKSNVNKSCTPVDLRAELPPVRDQDSIGWCYAFAAADLLSHKLKMHISAADLAMTHNNIWSYSIFKMFGQNEDSFEGGWIQPAIERLQKEGACLEENVRSEDNGYNGLEYNIQQISAYIEDDEKECSEELNSIFPKQQYSEFTKLARETSKMSVFEDLRNKNCHPRIDISKYKITEKITFNLYDQYPDIKENFFETIDSRLSQKNVTGITYFSSIFHSYKNDLSGEHASLIVGRRLNSSSGECEYLVRNSWGRSCDQYDYDCEEGNIWLPKSRLNQGLIGVAYLD